MTTLTSLIHAHFATHQRTSPRPAGSSLSPAALRSAAALRDELAQLRLSDSLAGLSVDEAKAEEGAEGAAEEVAAIMAGIVDSAMSALHAHGKDAADSASSVLELASALCGEREIGEAVVRRAIEYSAAPGDSARAEAAIALGRIVGRWGDGPAGILKGGKGEGVAASAEEWQAGCATLAAAAVLSRMTDKIARVRSAAVSACASFLSKPFGEECERIADRMEEALLWLASNDTSAANRALAVSVLPVGNVGEIVLRLRDADVKVREAALDALREKVSVNDLAEEDMADILRGGLTKRCKATHAKTVELLLCNWMKSLKYDPIALLDRLNPVLNEAECEKAVRVVIRAADAIDRDGDKSLDAARKRFGGPEIRSFKQTVARKMTIDRGELTPSSVFFLRIRCALAAESNESDLVSDVISDIPTLCNVLNSHLDKLIQFNKLTDEELEMDEDEAAAFEDDQNFICLQLIHMAKASDLEEGSRRHFNSILRSMLSRLETPDDLVEACVGAMAGAHDTEAQFLRTVSEVLVDVEDDDTYGLPGEKDAKAAAIVRQMRVIAILSVVLENVSSRMVGHPILDGFFEHLSPAITSKNAVVREHGVICLSKFCLLSEQGRVMDQFWPLLMTIAGSAEERVEVRAQAAMALCDLALIHDKMINLSGEESEGETASSSFKDLLLEMLGHLNPGIVVIAAEITAKLLLAGRFDDPILVAWLVAIFFDSSLLESQLAEEYNTAEEIGSPVRLQQLLSIFFPTYSMSSLDANDAIMASVGPLLFIICDKMEGMKPTKALAKWPVSKMVEYICYTVDIADKNKKKKVDAGDESPDNDLAEPTETGSLDRNKTEAKEDENIIEASSTLLASIDIAEYLAESSSHIPAFYARALAKILGSVRIDVDAEDNSLLVRLKAQVAEAEYSIDDRLSLSAIKKLSQLLEDIEEVESEEKASDEEVDNVAEALEKSTLVDTEKENPRRSSGTVESVSTKGARRDSSSRVSLGSVN